MHCLIDFFPLLTNYNKMDSNRHLLAEALLEIGNQAVDSFVYNADMNNESQPVKPHRWSHNSKIYPKFDEIAEALQDEGQNVKRNDKTTVQYKKTQKLCLKTCKNIMKECPGVLGENINRGTEQLVTFVLMSRNRVDLAECMTQHHRYHKEKSVRVIKGSDVTTGGFNTLL